MLDQSFLVLLRKDSARDQETFLDVVTSRLAPRGVDSDSLSWNSWRLDDGTWTIDLTYPNRDGQGHATWNFDLNRRLIVATDENGRWMLGQEPAARTTNPGLVHAEPSHPSRIVDSIPEPEQPRETPRLVAIRDTPRAEDQAEGITGRAKVPSWDEIMFGRAATTPTDDTDPEDDLFK